MLLDDHERRKFAAYCRQNERSNAILAEQMAKFDMGPVGNVLTEKLRSKSVAYAIVAAELEDAESVTVEKGAKP